MVNGKDLIIRNESLPGALRNLVRMYPSNQIRRQFYGGLPHLGNAMWGEWQSDPIRTAAEVYEKYSLSDNLLIPGFDKPKQEKIRLGGGSPARFESFPPAKEAIIKAVSERNWSDYPMAAGADEDKNEILKYLESIGFKNDNPYSGVEILDSGLTINNIIFTHSSTHGYSLIMESILDYGDIVLKTAPNYGLFSFNPERLGGKVELLELSADDNWLINPNKLEERIAEINEKLKNDYDRNRGKYVFRRSDSPPKVAAFVHMNPHNPTGKVYGEQHRSLLSEIGRICKYNNVFIIDDLAYRGLEFDRNNEAVPMSALNSQFQNTISLFSLSKSYGLASLRAGMIVADELVTSVIRDKIFQMSDSLSPIQSAALSAVFNGSNDKQERDEYLASITKEYWSRYLFVKSITDGIDSLEDSSKDQVRRIIDDSDLDINDEDFEGIEDISIMIQPESGFFILVDFSLILGKNYKGFEIKNDESLLQFLYTSQNIKILTGQAFCWLKGDQLVARVTTALEYKDLLESFLRLKKAIKQLK